MKRQRNRTTKDPGFGSSGHPPSEAEIFEFTDEFVLSAALRKLGETLAQTPNAGDAVSIILMISACPLYKPALTEKALGHLKTAAQNHPQADVRQSAVICGLELLARHCGPAQNFSGLEAHQESYFNLLTALCSDERQPPAAIAKAMEIVTLFATRGAPLKDRTVIFLCNLLKSSQQDNFRETVINELQSIVLEEDAPKSAKRDNDGAPLIPVGREALVRVQQILQDELSKFEDRRQSKNLQAFNEAALDDFKILDKMVDMLSGSALYANEGHAQSDAYWIKHLNLPNRPDLMRLARDIALWDETDDTSLKVSRRAAAHMEQLKQFHVLKTFLTFVENKLNAGTRHLPNLQSGPSPAA